ncbi:hypothetical protein K469DRAFT_691683 [Zopfia rhizophila CBS 207.26]|uniref:Mid2 domain-containing protein n=1 Tax=Zopfia rhizophila CBS 207.26 TaxID=1314779 RepID=A0A6A6DVR9_9PEZI|nr:hypothetical protein K469DRAFT_691683 [Zopfia rhizophila CBS 207.26]
MRIADNPLLGDQYLSNGLCYYPGGEYMFRGACTDKLWQSSSYFQHCKGGDMDNSYDELVSCGGDRYCCYSDGSTCCNDGSKVFTVGSASVVKDLATIASNTFSIETPTAVAETETGTYTSSSPAEPTSTESREAKPTGSGSKATNTAVATTATSTSTSQPTNSEDKSSSTHKILLIAGAIGGITILIIAVAIVWCLLRRRYRKKLATGSNPQSFGIVWNGKLQSMIQEY